MPTRVSQEELDVILEVVGRHPDGASPADIMEAPELDLSRRTLARRLQLLLEEGRIVPVGEGRARRYVLPKREEEPSETAIIVPVQNDGWLSSESQAIRELVTRPVTARHPVGYNADFLDSYVPNKTAYLPNELRRRLARVGEVGLADLPRHVCARYCTGFLSIYPGTPARLEGNTYSLLETKRLVELGETAEGKAAEETQMILNHKAAIEMLAEQAEEIGFNDTAS